MGRRSRKRRGSESGDLETRAERDAARRDRQRGASEAGAGGSPAPKRRSPPGRPPPPWGSFPLTELVVFVGLVLAVAGFVVGIEEARGRTMFIAGIVLGMLGGLETSVRDHFAGYRSHTTLLSGAVAIATIVVITLVLRLIAPDVPIVAMFAVGAVVFAAAFPLLRRTFQRRSGGLSFR